MKKLFVDGGDDGYGPGYAAPDAAAAIFGLSPRWGSCNPPRTEPKLSSSARSALTVCARAYPELQ
jgi:hypothetical protein